MSKHFKKPKNKTKEQWRTHLLFYPFFGLDIKSDVEEQGLLDKGSFIQPPDEQILSPLDAVHFELPEMYGYQ